MANFKFEDFTGSGKQRSTGGPQVTIRKHGNIALNKTAYAALGTPSKVSLVFDRTANVMGIAAEDAHRPGRLYKVSTYKEAPNRVIAGGEFCRLYGIETEDSRRYAAAMADGILAVDLNQQPIPVNRSARTIAAQAKQKVMATTSEEQEIVNEVDEDVFAFEDEKVAVDEFVSA